MAIDIIFIFKYLSFFWSGDAGVYLLIGVEGIIHPESALERNVGPSDVGDGCI